MNKDMERRRNQEVNGVCNADCLELGDDPVPQQTLTNCFQSIVSKPITYNNDFPPRKQSLIFQRQVNYV